MNLYGFQFNLVNVVVALLIGTLIGTTLLCSCAKVSIKEGLALLGADIGHNMSKGVPGDTWAKAHANSDTNTDSNADNIFAALKNNVAGSVPLPEGNMNFFYGNKFDPACCFSPNRYTSSSGCSCLSVDQVNYLNERGGNNTLENNN